MWSRTTLCCAGGARGPVFQTDLARSDLYWALQQSVLEFRGVLSGAVLLSLTLEHPGLALAWPWSGSYLAWIRPWLTMGVMGKLCPSRSQTQADLRSGSCSDLAPDLSRIWPGSGSNLAPDLFHIQKWSGVEVTRWGSSRLTLAAVLRAAYPHTVSPVSR